MSTKHPRITQLLLGLQYYTGTNIDNNQRERERERGKSKDFTQTMLENTEKHLTKRSKNYTKASSSHFSKLNDLQIANVRAVDLET